MGRKILILITLIAFGCVGFAAQPETEVRELFSPYNAQTLYDLTDGMYQAASTDVRQAKVAMLLIETATKLGLPPKNALEDVIRFSVLFPDNEYEAQLNGAFKEYLSDKSDLDVLRMIANHGFDQLDSREEREAYLLKMLRVVGKKNDAFASELTTQLATLNLEKGDTEAAKTQLIQAYDSYPYNRIAFERLREVFAASDLVLPPSVYADHLRREIVRNPSNLEAVLLFADYAERLELYNIACHAYDYAVELFRYIYPDDELPAAVYLPWAMACYNTQYARSKCFEIVADVRKSGQFDIVLEGISASLAAKVGNLRQSREGALAAQKAENILTDKTSSGSVTAEKLSWFYLFALPNYEKALAWANRAYSIDAKSDSVKALLGCAFAFNGNYDLAENLVGDLAENYQLAAIAMAMIQQDQDKQADAIETLKSAIEMDPASLAGEKARGMLSDLGSEYIPDTILQETQNKLENSFGKHVIGEFTPIDQLLSVKLGISGMDFRYGKNLAATLSITNKSLQPLVISESSLFSGRIRIDAEISGDINYHIPALLSKRIRPSGVIKPGDYILVPFELMTGQLKDILIRHPQANVEIEFTVHLDPVMNDDGVIISRTGFFEPVKKSVKRRAVNVSRDAMIAQLRYLSSGQMKQRIRSIQLFTGLLMEYYQSQDTGLPYETSKVELPILTSTIRKGLNDEDWTVKIQTMAALMPMRHNMEFSFINSISECLYDDQWPSRLMASYLLGSTQGAEFKPVLDSRAESDPEEIVRQFAQAMKVLNFGADPVPEIQPAEESPEPKPQEMLDMLLEP